jgi:uncharacterized spore protein YtfJ
MATEKEVKETVQEAFGPGPLESVMERFGATAQAKAVFGDPVERDGTTIIPVAHVRMGLGFGRGHGKGKAGGDGEGEGQGGGGGVNVTPVGYIQISGGQVTFHRVGASRAIPALAIIAGTVVLTLMTIGAAWGKRG